MNKVHRILSGAIFCCLLAAFPSARAATPGAADSPVLSQVAILSLSGNHYPGITRALSTEGFEVREVSSQAYLQLPKDRIKLLVIPQNEAQQLDTKLEPIILRDVENGMPLVLDGPSSLAGKLGLTLRAGVKRTRRYRWEGYAEERAILPRAVIYQGMAPSAKLTPLAFDGNVQAPLIVTGSRGKGRFIYSAIPLEPQQGMLFQYLPFLVQAIVENLHVSPSLAADNLCVYVDVGGEPQADPATIAARLKSWSVREVHLGAFYGSDTFREFIPKFLAAAHQQGIAVYAWLEYPMVSTEFWIDHPQWREVTANGKAAIMDWRYHMALEDPDCFKAVAELTRRLLLDYDWDGVDFAEFYFESDPGVFKHPREFTPMHPAFRKMFKDRYGVDPREIFNPESRFYGPRNPEMTAKLESYRVELLTKLTGDFLKVLAECQAQKPYLQTTLTMIDALRDPTVTERFAVDPARLLALQKQFGFEVEVEDPYTVWNSGGDRYKAIGEYYRPKLQPGTPLSLDINVTDRMPPGRPFNKPRGQELYDWIANAAADADMVTLYGFSTLSAEDMRLVPFVLGTQQISGGTSDRGTVAARRQIMWHTDTAGKTVYMDGREWPCRSDSQVLIPAGVHKVFVRPDDRSDPETALRIESVSGSILSADQSATQISITYESRGRCYVVLNRAPSTILCDGASGQGKELSDSDKTCVVLPQGKHTVQFGADRADQNMRRDWCRTCEAGGDAP